MSELSDYLENQIINHMLRNQAFTPPATVYLALFTAITGLEADNPTAEVSGNAYARQAITLTPSTVGLSSNSGALTFPVATPGAWGLISHVAIVDHLTNVTWGTNVHVLMWTQLDGSKQIDANDQFKINDGDLDIAID
jgi:hypothetical protein